MESQYLTVIRVWAALAWADGVIVEAEAIALRRLIARANMLTEEERALAFEMLREPVDLDAGSLTALSPSLRIGVYKAALQLAHIDKDFAEAEQLFLARLREALELDETTLTQLAQA